MKLQIRLLAFFCLCSTLTFAQATARLQVIHNSPTPTVDIYANGARLLDNFAFRTATPFIDVPAGVTVNIGVAPATSTSVRDTIANFPVVFEAGKRYVVVAHGVVGNATTPFRLALTDLGQETVTPNANVGIAFFHGSPNAPAVDIRTGGNVLFGNVSYGRFGNSSSPYLSVPANATYRLAVTAAGSASTVVAEYNANLSFWGGKTAVIFASGFLNGTNPDSRFEPWVALSNGGTFPLNAVTSTGGNPPATANLQVIHNSPTPTVDIYVNGGLLLDNFAFRTATPYISVPAGTTLSIAVAPATSRSVADAIATIPVRLDSGKTYVAVAHGIVGDTSRPFTLALSDAGRMQASNPNNVDVNFFHGSPDAPAVNISTGGNVLFGNVAYSRFGNYISVPSNATYTLGVAAASAPSTTLARYNLNLDFWRGKSAIVMATGFLGGRAPGFEPWVVLSNGGTFPLFALPGFGGDIAETSAFSAQKPAFAVSPNPAKDNMTVNFDMAEEAPATLEVVNLTGQVVLNNRWNALNKGAHQISFDLNGLSNGYYMVRLESAGVVKTQKLVINR